jgi:hypothetical protein
MVAKRKVKSAKQLRAKKLERKIAPKVKRPPQI